MGVIRSRLKQIFSKFLEGQSETLKGQNGVLAFNFQSTYKYHISVFHQYFVLHFFDLFPEKKKILIWGSWPTVPLWGPLWIRYKSVLSTSLNGISTCRLCFTNRASYHRNDGWLVCWLGTMDRVIFRVQWTFISSIETAFKPSTPVASFKGRLQLPSHCCFTS